MIVRRPIRSIDTLNKPDGEHGENKVLDRRDADEDVGKMEVQPDVFFENNWEIVQDRAE